MPEINDIEEIPEGNFLIYFKLIQKYQREEPSITAKCTDGTYHKGCFCEVSNIDLKLIACKDKIIILSILQSYVVHWYHAYLLHPGTDRTEAMICQPFYWTHIRDAVWKEGSNCDTFQHTKQSNKNMVNYRLS